jgi:hypothetical protein
MKILFFRGSFIWDENALVACKGLICFCHVEVGDFIKINTIANLIYEKKKEGDEIVLVPFPYLDDPKNKMGSEATKEMLRKLKTLIKPQASVYVACGSKRNILDLSVLQADFGVPDDRISRESI